MDRAGAVEATFDRADLLSAGAGMSRKLREAEQHGRGGQREFEAHENPLRCQAAIGVATGHAHGIVAGAKHVRRQREPFRLLRCNITTAGSVD